MTIAEATARHRSIIDETGVTTGYVDDTNDLLKWFDSGENELIQFVIKNNPDSDILAPIVALDPLNTTTIGSSRQEYNLPSDFNKTYRASYNYAGTGTGIYPCTKFTFDEVLNRENNDFEKATADSPVYYIKGSKIGFYPQPIGAAANMYEHFYFKQKTAISTAFTLVPLTHEPIVWYAVAMYFLKDGQNENALTYLKKFYEGIAGL